MGAVEVRFQRIDRLVTDVDVPAPDVRGDPRKPLEAPHEIDGVRQERHRISVGLWTATRVHGVVNRILSLNQRVAWGFRPLHRLSSLAERVTAFHGEWHALS